MKSSRFSIRKSPEDNTATIRRLSTLLRPHRGALITVLIMLIALAVLNMILPAYFIKLLLDDVFQNQDWTLLAILLAGILLVYVGRNALYFFSKFTTVVIGEQVCFKLRKRLFETLQQMNLQFYRENKAGKLSSRVMDDSYVIQQFIQDDLPSMLQASLLFLGLVGWIYAINWQLALVSTIVLPLHLVAFFWFRRPIKRASGAAAEQLAIVRGNLIEKMLGIEVVKSFTGEAFENDEFEQAIDRSRESELKSKKYHVTQKIVADLIVGLGTVGLLGFGAFQVMKPTDPMTVGMFSAFLTLVLKLYPTVLELMSGFAKLTKASASIDRVFDMLEAQSSRASEYDHKANHLDPAAIASRISGEIRFDHVHFSYGDGEPVLQDIDLTIPAGKVCAIVGPSGSGKSTLASLVPRFNDCSSGRILIDGQDVQDIQLPGLRQAIGIAFQETFLFNSTILENIRYARPDVSLDQIITVARRTGAHEFIQRMPDGYNTLLGENGVSLSRGEKQRITLTRAMLKDPKILILDEATASIDAQSAGQIMPNILDFMEGKTTLLITHRQELLEHADLVLRIEHGRVVYKGSPMDLSPEQGGMITPPSSSHASSGRSTSGIWPSMNGWLIAIAMGLAMMGLTADLHGDEPEDQKAPPANTGEVEGIFRPMQGLGELEVNDLIEVAIARMISETAYGKAGEGMASHMPMPQPGIRGITTLARSGEDGLYLLQVGYRTFRSQPPHLWIYGRMFPAEGQTQLNPDVTLLDKHIEAARKAREEHSKSLKVQDLATETITLSYIETDRALGIFKTLGYQTIEYKANANAPGGTEYVNPTSEVDVAKLPAIAALPSTNTHGLVGGGTTQGGSFGLTMTPSVATSLPAATAAAPMMQLMVLYDPAKPQQYSEVLDRLKRSIDLPARQILIEAMVLEISESGLDSLGVQWTLDAPQGNLGALTLGRLPNLDGTDGPTVTAEINDAFGAFKVKIEALVREGKAEVLSRPSVLTLDNRQASIRVGEDIPVATSASGLRGGDRISFDFRYIPIGILLNVRPRVSSDSEDVSMQIDGIVSATVPGEDLIVFDADGAELARAPRISTRRVQTYSRIANNTPFIIGGLISKFDSVNEDKVPILGDIPYLGTAFKNRRTITSKREVIIVITPYVVPENNLAFRGLPKDEDSFDSVGHKLFHDVYRIRAEDLYDLNFITDNRRLRRVQDIVNQAVRRDFKLAERYPFNRFIGNRFPGEDILVFRQMYEVIRRVNLDAKIKDENIIYFEPDPDNESGFSVEFLQKKIESLVGGELKTSGLIDKTTVNTAFDQLDKSGKALMITYTRYTGSDIAQILRQPVPEVKLIPCANREVWGRLLWEFNQPDAEGRERHTIILKDYRDFLRLRRAIALKHMVRLNSSQATPNLNNFSIGRLLLMPHLQVDKVHLIDGEVAAYFFYTEHYYPALEKRLEHDIAVLRKALTDPRIMRLFPAGDLDFETPDISEVYESESLEPASSTTQ